MKRAVVVGALALCACSIEKLPPTRMVHRTPYELAKRVVVLPTQCVPAAQARMGEDPRAWCAGVEQLVASELAFRGVEVVDLSRLPAQERTRQEIEISSTIDGASAEHTRVTVNGPMFSDVDMWQQRYALATLGVDGLVRISVAQTATWPVRAVALVRITRPGDAMLIDASVCEMEVSRIDSQAAVIEKSVRCALGGLR